MISAKEVLDRLKEGNQRFVSGAGQLESHMVPRLRREFVIGRGNRFQGFLKQLFCFIAVDLPDGHRAVR